MAKGLTGKARRFADNYLVDCNATRAYKAAGYTAKDDTVAASCSSKLLRKPKVAAYIAGRQEKASSKLEVTAEKVVRELARIGFADPRLAASWGPAGVVLKPSADLDDDAAAAIAEVQSKHTEWGVDLKFKLHDKVAALDKLARHLGLFEDEDKSSLASILAQIVANSMPKRDP